MAGHYHITLDDELSESVEQCRHEGRGVKRIFAKALEHYRALDALIEKGYRESAGEDLQILEEFRDADLEAEAIDESGFESGAR